jgi:hypothetical protein
MQIWLVPILPFCPTAAMSFFFVPLKDAVYEKIQKYPPATLAEPRSSLRCERARVCDTKKQTELSL